MLSKKPTAYSRSQIDGNKMLSKIALSSINNYDSSKTLIKKLIIRAQKQYFHFKITDGFFFENSKY
jgi:hypothetical protein